VEGFLVRGRMVAMRFRKLRIAFSAVCGILCVLLIALWARSYWWVDGINGQLTENYAIGIGSMPGCIGINIRREPERPLLPRWTLTTVETERWMTTFHRPKHSRHSRLWGAFIAERSLVAVPYWFATMLIFIPTTFVAAPFLRWRFSLRTLLIVTTLVAALLGWAVYSAKK
jgi:4-amino-4-deoxy-L-arabinose transferase-like glycosyltransferase